MKLTDKDNYISDKKNIIKRFSKLSELDLVKLSEKQKNIRKISTVVESYSRNSTLSELVKKIAAGKCQLCKNDAPFYVESIPYLESHHVKWLSNGGTDTIDNMVALCPNCHRKMHFVNDEKDRETLSLIASNNVNLYRTLANT